MKEAFLLKLYHVTTDFTHSGFFKPAIPSIRLEGENSTMKRVSLSFSIEGCLTAMPKGGVHLEKTLEETNGYLRIIELDTIMAGLTADDLILPFYLYEKGWVMDALATEEVWVLKPFQAQKIFDVRVVDFEAFEEELIPDWVKHKPPSLPVLRKIENITLQKIKESIIYEKQTTV